MKFIAFLIVAVGAVFGYFNFYANRPVDLGQKYSSADYQQAHDKITTQVTPLKSDTPINQSLVYSGSKDINIILNSSEITSYLQSEKWTYAPISQVQVRINSDGTAESSGIIHLDKVLPYVGLTTPIVEVKKAIDKFHISGNPAFYAQGSVKVVNNQVQFNVQNLSIAKIPVPANYIGENITAINDFATSKINSVPNLKVKSLELLNGQVKLDATVPATVQKAQM